MIRKKIDAKGRIAIGPRLMEELGLKPGDEVDVELTEDGKAIVLGPKGLAAKASGNAADRLLDALARALEGRLREGIQERKE